MTISKSHQGFTVLELLVTITIGSILLAIAIPSFSTIIQNNRRSAYVNEFVRGLTYARGQAVTLRKVVVMCRSLNPTATTPECSDAANSWHDGWIVFSDINDNGVIDAAADTVFLVHEAISANKTTLCGNTAKVKFNKTGLSPTNNGTIRYCDARGTSQGREMIISLQGRVRTTEALTTCSRTETTSAASCS